MSHLANLPPLPHITEEPDLRYALHKGTLQRDASESHQRLQDGKKDMLANGWCSHLVNHLSEHYDLETFICLTNLPRSPRRLEDHSHCHEHPSCIAYNVDLAKYETRHTTESCRCRMVRTPYSELVDCIRSGKVPLISIERGGSGDYEMRVHARTWRSRCIAVSQVWADGLGNTNECALPTCQIKRIGEEMSTAWFRTVWFTAAPVKLFWLDTLCIPVGRAEVMLRLSQIDNMASVYTGAMHCLVLDRELQDTEVAPRVYMDHGNDTDDAEQNVELELRARIHCSVWMSRSWTFQEGALSRLTVIPFHNACAYVGRSRWFPFWKLLRMQQASPSAESPVEQFMEDNAAYIAKKNRSFPDMAQAGSSSVPIALSPREPSSSLRPCCPYILGELRDSLYTGHGSHHYASFESIWNQLSARSTTKPDDIPFILGNLLYLDTAPLLECDGSREMLQAILLSREQIPLSLFFLSSLSQRGDETCANPWVPAATNEVLSESDQLQVHPTYLQYAYLHKDRQRLSIFQASAQRHTPYTYFRDAVGDCVYKVKPKTFDHRPANDNDFERVCIVIENSGKLDFSTKRGACFHVLQASGSIPELNFISSLRLDQLPESLPVDFTSICSHELCTLEHDCELHINYDVPPDFKPLKRRSIVLFDTFFESMQWAFMFVILTVEAVTFKFDHRYAFGFLGLWPVLYAVGIWIGGLMHDYSDWHRSRSFEAIASRHAVVGVA